MWLGVDSALTPPASCPGALPGTLFRCLPHHSRRTPPATDDGQATAPRRDAAVTPHQTNGRTPAAMRSRRVADRNPSGPLKELRNPVLTPVTDDQIRMLLAAAVRVYVRAPPGASPNNSPRSPEPSRYINTLLATEPPYPSPRIATALVLNLSIPTRCLLLHTTPTSYHQTSYYIYFFIPNSHNYPMLSTMTSKFTEILEPSEAVYTHPHLNVSLEDILAEATSRSSSASSQSPSSSPPSPTRSASSQSAKQSKDKSRPFGISRKLTFGHKASRRGT
ncbi:hypothetical protein M011DRAFT_458537 [Sporormia fimetaria CBS 119925]|uniref:Uncharacterized protein n=1 Tax=Sporormia fimetaria CBS 119925 TaxID=1340428 RepID=A0A6A6VCE1_9PLEO|nr:hypothetical protein M011DRAFT_458537 [Sporormia fimetaria CBS 119925]